MKTFYFKTKGVEETCTCSLIPIPPVLYLTLRKITWIHFFFWCADTYPSEHIDVLILLQAPNLCVYSIRESNSLVKILETLFLLNHSTIHFCVVCHTKDSNEYPWELIDVLEYLPITTGPDGLLLNSSNPVGMWPKRTHCKFSLTSMTKVCWNIVQMVPLWLWFLKMLEHLKWRI